MIPKNEDISEMLKVMANNINQLNIGVLNAGGGFYEIANRMDKPLSELLDTLARNNIYITTEYKPTK